VGYLCFRVGVRVVGFALGLGPIVSLLEDGLNQPQNGGLGCPGRDVYSGWNCVPKKNG